jgi:nucleoside-triphosphatase
LGNLWSVTGAPGVGKSTLVSKVVYRLKSAGVIVGGCITAERRSKGARVGFEIRDLTGGRTGELSSVDLKMGPKVGRYRVNLKDLASVGAAGLEEAATKSEVIVIDEVGPMELVSPEFRRAVQRCLASGRAMLVVLHERLEDDLLIELRKESKENFEVTIENREEVEDRLVSDLLRAAGASGKGA